MVGRLELELSCVELRDKLVHHALHPQHGFLFGKRRTRPEGLAADGPDEAKRKRLALARNIAFRSLRDVEHLANFEEHRSLKLVRGVAPERAHHLREKRVAHNAILRRHWVGNYEAAIRGTRVKVVKLLLRKERVVHRLGEAEREAKLANTRLRAERRIGKRRNRRRGRHRVGNVVEPVKPRDFLDEIGLG